MKKLGFILVPFLCLHANSSTDAEAVTKAARTAPPEVASDALLRIAAVTDARPARIALIEEAFDRAGGAEEAYRRYSPVRANTASAYWNRVNQQGLDAMSLRLRAVAAMLSLDAGKARDLFLRIPPLKLPRLTCADFILYDPAPFYDMAGEIARQTFPAGAADDSSRFRFLSRYAGAMTSPVAIGPLARMLASAQVTNSEFQQLVASYAKALANISGDDRSFTYSQKAGPDIESLVAEMNRRKLSPLPLLESYRVYLVFNLSAPRCADSDLMRGEGRASALVTAGAATEDAVTFFNTKLRMAPLQPISELESTPAHMEGTAQGLSLCQDAECKAVAGQLRGLIVDAGGKPFTTETRRAPEWQAAFDACVQALDSWKQSTGISSADFFREKSQAYSELLNLSEGPRRNAAARSLLAFLAASPERTAHRAEWLLPANALAGRISLEPAAMADIAAEMRASADPVIALYAKLEAVAPRTASQVLPLL